MVFHLSYQEELWMEMSVKEASAKEALMASKRSRKQRKKQKEKEKKQAGKGVGAGVGAAAAAGGAPGGEGGSESCLVGSCGTGVEKKGGGGGGGCLLYTSPSPRDLSTSRMPSSA